MATTIFTPQIALSNEVCDSIEVPRGTQITLSRDLLEQNMLIAIPDDLCDFIEVPRDTKMPRTEIERIGKKYVRDNIHFIEASWDKLIFNKDLTITDEEEAKLIKLFRLRALIKPETYPLPIEVCKLLEIPAGTPMNRFDLENQVNEYIRVRKLMIKNNMVNLCEDGGNLRNVFLFWNNNNAINHYDMVMSVMAYFVKKIQLANTLKGEFKMVAFAISDELADFLKVAHGTKMSLTDAVLSVAKYTYENDLQIWDTKKNSFTLDASLRTLFSLSEADALEITYEALERHVKKHFAEKVSSKSVLPLIEISDDLCDFYEVPHGTKMRKIDAILGIVKYTWDHTLKFGENNYFTANDQLVKLFGMEIGEERKITYDRIEKLLSKHFVGSA